MGALITLQFILPLLLAVLLLATGYISGRYLERKHYEHIIAEETRPDQVMVFPSRLPPPSLNPPDSALVMGSVVISVDYFKRFIATLRMLVGGRLNSYESLLDRARREALLRMRAEAEAMGAKQVFNVKYETAVISGRSAQSQVGSLEVLAYGTAIIGRH